MSQSTSRPLPSFPVELKKEILRFCDQDTLAKAARVSFAFLELASPLLYQNIVVHGYEGLAQLLQKVNPEQQQPHLDTYTDLLKVKAVKVVVQAGETETPEERDPPFPLGGRLPPSGRLFNVTCLTLEVRKADSKVMHIDFRTILRIFNPTSCFIAGPSAFPSPLWVDLDDLVWDHLESITFKDSGPREFLRLLFPQVETQPFTVVHDVSDQVVASDGAEAIMGILGDIAYFHERYSLFGSPSFATFVLRVKDKEQARALSTKIQGKWMGYEIDPDKQREWAKRVQFEVVGSEDRVSMKLE